MQEKVQLKLNVRPELHEKLKSAASLLRRPLNAEMIARLESTFEVPSLSVLRHLIEAKATEMSELRAAVEFLEFLESRRPNVRIVHGVGK